VGGKDDRFPDRSISSSADPHLWRRPLPGRD
jgi:hypothetical protein